jgi:hypothetical protein
MGWQTIVALVVIVPVLLAPVALVWYINFRGFAIAMKEARARKVAHKTTEQKVTTK